MNKCSICHGEGHGRTGHYARCALCRKEFFRHFDFSKMPPPSEIYVCTNCTESQERKNGHNG